VLQAFGDSSLAANLAHCRDDLLNQLVLDFEFLESHLSLPDVLGNLVFKFKDVITLQAERDSAERAGIARVAVPECRRHDPEIERLIEAEHEDKIAGPMLFSQGFDGFLLRKTCGAGSSSDETGGRFVYDFGAGCFDTVADGETCDIIALTEHRHFLAS